MAAAHGCGVLRLLRSPVSERARVCDRESGLLRLWPTGVPVQKGSVLDNRSRSVCT